MTFFLVIDLFLRIFPFFSHIFRMFTMLNVVYDHSLTRKTQFFTLFMLSRTSDNTTSQNIGRTNAWAVPHLKFWGDRPPSPPRSPPLLQLVGRRHLRSSYRGIAAFLSLMSTVTFSTVKPLRRAFSFVAFYIWNALSLEVRLLPKGNTLLLYELLNSVMYYHDWDGNASE